MKLKINLMKLFPKNCINKYIIIYHMIHAIKANTTKLTFNTGKLHARTQSVISGF